MSLTSTGIATLTHLPGTDGHAWAATTATIETRPSSGTPALLDRIAHIADLVGKHAHAADLLVIESGAYATRTSMAHALAGCWWLVYRQLATHNVPILEIPPTRVKKYATGRGRADKAAVAASAARLWPATNIDDNNQADALILATLGAHTTGRALPFQPAQHQTDLAEALT